MSVRFATPSMLVSAMLSTAVFGVGCGSNGQSASDDVSPNSVDEMRVPTTAEIAIQGRGRLDHTFRRDGRMWLFDATAEKTLFTIPVSRGQRFTVIPSEDRAALDGQNVFGGDMELRNEHRIYYLPKR